MTHDWTRYDLAQAKVDDFLLVFIHMGHGGHHVIRRVVATSKTTVTDQKGTRWTRRGRKYGEGDSYYRDSAEHITDIAKATAFVAEETAARVAKAKHRDLASAITAATTQPCRLSLDQLERMAAIMDEKPQTAEDRIALAQTLGLPWGKV